HDDERIAATELEDAFLDLARGRTGHLATGPLASGERDRFHSRVIDHRPDLLRFDKQSLKNAFGKTGAEKNVFEGERALRDVRGVLEQGDVTGHQGRSGETNDLPEGKV